MSDSRVVVVTVDELDALVRKAVRETLGDVPSLAPASGGEMTIADVVSLFRLAAKSGPKTVYRWRREQGFPAPRKFGGRVRWSAAEVNAWRRSRPASGPGTVARRTRGGGAAAPQGATQ